MDQQEKKKKKEKGQGKEIVKQVKGESSVKAQSLISQMDTSKNLFSQLSAQYLSQKEDELDTKEKEFLKKQKDNTQSLFHQFDIETQRILHGLGKKSSTTKLRSFGDLRKILGEREEDFFELFTPTYVNIYKTIVSVEIEKKVLEEANAALKIICQRGRKSLQSKFKDLFPMWFLVINDFNAEVSNSALQAFEIGFPKEKWGQAVILCEEGYLKNINYYLKLTPKQVQQENIYLEEGQADFIYERLVTSAVLSIQTACQWINNLSEEKQKKFHEDLMEVLGLKLLENSQNQKKHTPLILEVLDHNRKRPRVQSNVLNLLTYFFKHEKLKAYSIEIVDLIGLKTLHLMDDPERLVQQSLWNGYIISIFQAIPYKRLLKFDQTMLENKLMDVTKNSGYGVGRPFFEQLPILLSSYPHCFVADLLEADFKQETFRSRLVFMKNVLEKILQGLVHEEARFFSEHVVNCYFECLYFLVIKRIQLVLNKQNEQYNQVKNILRDLIKLPFNKFLKNEFNQIYSFNPMKQFPLSLAQYFEMTSLENTSPQIVQILELCLKEFADVFFQEGIKNQVTFTNFINIIEQLLVKVTQKSAVYGAVCEFIQKVYQTVTEQFFSILKSPTINDIDFAIISVENFKLLWEQFNQKKERSILLQDKFKVIYESSPIQDQIIQLFKLIFASIQFYTLPHKIIHLTFVSVNLLESYESVMGFYKVQTQPMKIFMEVLESIKTKQVEKSKQQVFKLTCICLFICATKQIKPEFYNDLVSVKGDQAQEWSVLEKYVSKLQPHRSEQTEFGRDLVLMILGVDNMNLKAFIPGMIELSHNEAVLNAIITRMNSKDQLYEELFFLLNYLIIKKRKVDPEVVYQNVWEVILELLKNNFSQRTKRLFKIIQDSARSKNEKLLETQLNSAINFYKKILGQIIVSNQYQIKFNQIRFENFSKFAIALQENFQNNPNGQRFQDQLIRATLSVEFYKNALNNSQIWRTLQMISRRDQVKRAEILQQMWDNLDNQSSYLFATFLASSNSFAVLWDHCLKRFMQNFVQNSVKPIILDSFEQNDGKILKLVECLYKMSAENSQIYGLALKQLLKQFIVEEKHINIDCSDLMQQILQLLICDNIKRIFQQNGNEKILSEILIVRQILSLIDFKNETTAKVLFESINADKLYNMLTGELDPLTFHFALDCYIILLRQQQDLLQIESDEKLDKIISKIFSLKGSVPLNYHALVLFEFINLICERKTITPFAAYITEASQTVKDIFNMNAQKPQEFYSFTFVSVLTFIRKILSFVEAFPADFLDFLSFSVYDSCISFVQQCESNLVQTTVNEQNETMFTEFAETMLRIQQMSKLTDESQLYTLLGAPLISLQKAGFQGLKEFFSSCNNSIKQISDYQQLQQIIQSVDFHQEERERIKQAKKLVQEDEEIDIESPLTLPLQAKQLAYFLGWNIATDPKIKNPELTKIIKSLIPTYLNNLAYLLEFLEESGVQCQLDTKEVYNGEIDLATVQDDQSELFKLVIIGLYQIIITQQGYFKQWVEQQPDRILVRQIEEYIRNQISKAIYEREIEIIENGTEKWKSEDFEIFASHNVREITAIYTKEGQKLEIVIQVPQEFPLKGLKIEVKRGVKIGEAKLNKWTLMIRMLLQNENDSIMNGLILWKENIDKQFEGLEECAVCYYIIHSNGELPKMACRTCKHKFHGSCLQKWFQSSNKSECPLCKSQFL